MLSQGLVGAVCSCSNFAEACGGLKICFFVDPLPLLWYIQPYG